MKRYTAMGCKSIKKSDDIYKEIFEGGRTDNRWFKKLVIINIAVKITAMYWKTKCLERKCLAE